MNAPEDIANKVGRGLVLDGKGLWVPLGTLKAMERAILMHLEAGEVLCEGKWVGIASCKSSSPPSSGRRRDDPVVSAARPGGDVKSTPWTIVSLSTGAIQETSENMAPLVKELGAGDASPDEPVDAWENSSRSHVKIIALVSSAIVLLSLAVFVAVRLIF
jgi:hypothetical protein